MYVCMQACRSAVRQAGAWAGIGQVCIAGDYGLPGGQADRQTGRQAGRQAGRQTASHAGRQAGRQAGN